MNDAHRHIQADGCRAGMVGEYQAIPASFPFTVTTKVAGVLVAERHNEG